MNHLTADETIDAVEGTLAPSLQAHVETCAACREEVARLTSLLHEVSSVTVPEPSPLFWDRFSARVSDAIAEEPVAAGRWLPAWLRLPVLAPIGALALLLVALTSALPREHTPSSPSEAATAAVTPDAEWTVVTELVGPLDLDIASQAGIGVEPGAAERAALSMTADEQQRLVALLKAEIERAGG